MRVLAEQCEKSRFKLRETSLLLEKGTPYPKSEEDELLTLRVIQRGSSPACPLFVVPTTGITVALEKPETKPCATPIHLALQLRSLS